MGFTSILHFIESITTFVVKFLISFSISLYKTSELGVLIHFFIAIDKFLRLF